MRWFTTFSPALVALFLQATPPNPVAPDPDLPNPIAAADTRFIEEMTWMEVRDARNAGKRTVLVATGGIEQNGPYLVAGKHNVVLRGTTDAIARRLGDALIAPIIGFVPEGDIDPPSLHMKYPSTVSVREETYRALVRDVCECYKTHGFQHVVLLGDSGGNQDGLKAVAAELNQKWGAAGPQVHYIPEYYNYAELGPWLAERGVKQTDEGLHDDYAMSAQMIAVDPTSVRAAQRKAAGKLTINGVSLEPLDKTADVGRQIIAMRAEKTVAAIRKARGR